MFIKKTERYKVNVLSWSMSGRPCLAPHRPLGLLLKKIDDRMSIEIIQAALVPHLFTNNTTTVGGCSEYYLNY